MFKDFINQNLKRSVKSSSKLNYFTSNNSKVFQKFNFSTDPKRIIDLEQDQKIHQILKHKNFVNVI